MSVATAAENKPVYNIPFHGVFAGTAKQGLTNMSITLASFRQRSVVLLSSSSAIVKYMEKSCLELS